MFNWNLVALPLTLKVPWKIARGSSESKTNFVVEVEKDGVKGVGEVAPNVRYGETPDIIQQDYSRFLHALPSDLCTLNELITLLEKLSIVRSLKFGIESAFIHYMAFTSNQSVASIIGTKSILSARTSFSLSLLPVNELGNYIRENSLTRFDALKVKLDKNDPLERFTEVIKNFHGRIRLDGNEAWSDPDEVLKFLEKIDNKAPIDFLEQPLPSHLVKEAKYLKKKSPFPLMADESVVDGVITQELRSMYDGVNIKLMKSGGYFKAMKQIKEAREFGFSVMIGCMIESGLGISSALNIACGADFFDLDGCLLIKDDPNPFILEENGKIYMSHVH